MSGGSGFIEYSEGIPKDKAETEMLRLKVKLQDIGAAELEEELIREKYPAVKDAWEHYQVMLRLAKGE